VALKRYRTIVADPPWTYEKTGLSFRAETGGEFVAHGLPYGSMEIERIGGLPVGELAEPDAHIFVWTTQRYLEPTYGILRGWGFLPSCALIWCKPPHGWGPGGVFQSTVEFVLYGRRGTPEPSRQVVERQWWSWPRTAHSQKPEAFLDLVERHFPSPRVELFARRARFGWDYWGDESLQTAEMPS
jgi:N6-adenosine-specific RNA methylase IME4